MFPIRVNENNEVSLVGPWGDNSLGKLDLEEVKPHPLPTGIMPPVIRYLSPARNLLIFERPPHPVTIKYYGRRVAEIDADTRYFEFDVHLPWTLYVVYMSGSAISNVYLYGLSEPYHERSILGLLPIPNYYQDGRFCIPEETYKFTSIADAMSTAYNIVWDSNFNIDVTEAVTAYYGGLHSMPSEFVDKIHKMDAKRRSAAGLLKAFSKMSKDEVESVNRWFVSSFPQIHELPSMADVKLATPEMFQARINQAIV